ncbi:hypothetical protein [Acetobacter papayae]|uniref:hypothetical protein n=1 Tax=Acetobacter papayae TaxID=1076592 RepID=UPI0011DCB093|nr:hypothetical protein [Acetobacter papayae]
MLSPSRFVCPCSAAIAGYPTGGVGGQGLFPSCRVFHRFFGATVLMCVNDSGGYARHKDKAGVVWAGHRPSPFFAGMT